MVQIILYTALKVIKTLKNLIFTPTGKDTLIVFAGTAVNVVTGGLFFVIVPRILGPSSYGLFSTVVATSIFVVSFANFGIDTGILKFAKKGSPAFNKYLSLAFYSYILLGLLVSISGVFLSGPISIFLAHPELTSLFRIAFSATILLLLTNFYSAGLQAQEKFTQASLVNISSNVLRFVIISLALVFMKVDLTFVTSLFFFVTLISIVTGVLFLPIKLEKIAKVDLLKFHNYNFWIGASLIIASFPLDNYVLVKLAGAKEAGIYSAPFKILTFVYQFAGNFSRVLAPRFSSFETNKKAKTFAIKSFSYVILFSFFIFVLALFATPLIRLLFGNNYSDAIPVFRILTIGFIFFFASAIPVSIILYYLGSSRISFILTVLNVVLFFLLLLIMVPAKGAQGASLAFSLTETLYFLACSSYVLIKLNK